MRTLEPSPKISFAYRRATTVFLVAAIIATSPVLIAPAYAFKIFGITLFGKDKEEDAQIPDPLRYDVSITTVSDDKDLRKAVENASLLEADKERPVSGDLGVVVKARDDRDRLIATLYERARYGAVVKVSIDGKDIDALAPNPVFDRSKPIKVDVNVTPGPVFRVNEVQLGGDAARRNAADYGLTAGAEAGSLLIIKAGDKLVEDIRGEGRPLAKLTKREVVANHKTNTVDIVLAAEGGPVAAIGDVSVTGQKTVRPDFIERYSRLKKGDRYSPEQLKKSSERLRALGVFSSVSLQQADRLAPDNTLPLTIEVSEAKLRYFGVGAQYSTTDGFGLNGYWGHRNLFGGAEGLRIEGSVSRLGANDLGNLDYSAGITFTKPGAFFPSATLTASILAKTQNPDAYSAQLVTAGVGLAYELSDQDTVSAGGEVSWEKDDDAFGKNTYLTLALPLTYDHDARDNKLDPTEGYRATAKITPSYEIYEGTFFTPIEGSITGYLGLGAEDRVVLAAKLAGGIIVGGDDISAIPATRRFFAGGGGSVRGYGFQEISPYNAAGEETGGQSYVTASLEARFKVTDTIGIVPFIDVGNVSADIVPDFGDIRAGAGIGVRYATPFGPLRLDFAVPLNKYEGGTQYGIYAGIGQSF